MGNEGMKPQRSTAKRRRERPTIQATSVVLTIVSIIVLLPCGSQTRGGLFIAAFNGRFMSRSRSTHQGRFPGCPSLSNSPSLSYAPPCKRRPFHHFCPQRDHPLRLLQLSSTAVDVPESSDSSSPASVSESSAEPTLPTTNGVVEPFNGAAVAPSNTTLVANHANGATNVALEEDDANIPIWEMDPPQNQNEDVPHPTANGGFSHTKASKAKISAANKGKTPWNKGKSRSEETRARIAAGVRAKNRERLLQKIKDMGLTEEQYEQQKKDERRKKDAERRARRTEKGGYRPTKETRKKISKILKAKWANGEMKKTPVHPDKIRRGFTHSAETRAKISESLKKRWAEDPVYRENMITKCNISNGADDVKKRISESLKKRWQDPEFRAQMESKIATRKGPEKGNGLTHRERISAAMKAKWMDPEYRKKAVDAMAKRRLEMGIVAKPKPKRKKKKKKAKDAIRLAQPRATKTRKKKQVVKVRKVKTRNKSKTTKPKRVRGVKNTEPEGSISRLREERRDLYDLLYADEDDNNDQQSHPIGRTGGINTAFALGDEDLDDFDPYGLEDGQEDF